MLWGEGLLRRYVDEHKFPAIGHTVLESIDLLYTPLMQPLTTLLICLTPPAPLSIDTRTDIDDFLTVLPLLQELSKDSIQPRHWTEVMEVLYYFVHSTCFSENPLFRSCAFVLMLPSVCVTDLFINGSKVKACLPSPLPLTFGEEAASHHCRFITSRSK